MEVLLVDDDPAVRQAVGKALGRAGFGVTAVDNGLAALTAVQTHSFGVVVTDIRMDFLDGMRLFRELEAEYPELAERLVFVSAWSDDAEVDAFVKGTGRPLLRKPFELPELVDLVRQTAAPGEYRADDYIPFSAVEAAELTTMGLRSGGTLACPRCRGPLSVRGVGRDQSSGWELRCHVCRRSLAVMTVALPSQARPIRSSKREAV